MWTTSGRRILPPLEALDDVPPGLDGWARLLCEKHSTICSFALSQLVMIFLQQCSPPILPPILRLTLDTDDASAALAEEAARAASREPIRCLPASEIRRKSDAMRDVDTMNRLAAQLGGFGSQNAASLAELLPAFFEHLSAVSHLWSEGLVASAYAGRWVASGTLDPGTFSLGVEDPFVAGSYPPTHTHL